ncbi:MAG: (d)CMP kinase [Candidatus Melainabacteria bacterium]|nr:(d)CMP kinase [Candidatus Melainabacteria bacterium]
MKDRNNGRTRVAIDGPAGAGKSTVAKLLADELGMLYVDTGAMYRAATWLAVRDGLPLDDGKAVAGAIEKAEIRLERAMTPAGHTRVFLDGEEITDQIRTKEISRLVSPVSALPEVRAVLVERQKEMARQGSVVLDGRDIGTVVIPDAELKVFLTATPEERARRRVKDLERLGEQADFEAILEDINQRDHRDSTRTASPLIKADDAVELYTDNLSIEEVVQKLVGLCRK